MSHISQSEGLNKFINECKFGWKKQQWDYTIDTNEYKNTQVQNYVRNTNAYMNKFVNGV
jgi:hypothetical protein